MRNKKTARESFIFALLVCWIGITFCDWRQTQADDSGSLQTIAIGYQAGDEFDTLQVRGGLVGKMEAQGYKVVFKEFQNGSAEIQTLASDSIDYARIGDTPGVSALAAGTNLTYVAAGGKKNQGSGTLMHNGSGIDSVENLARKAVACTQGTSSQYLVVKALAAAGLTTDGVNLVSLDQNATGAAYVDGAVDAWANWDSAASRVEITDNPRLTVNDSNIGDNDRSYIVVASDLAEENEEVAALLIEHTDEDMEWADGNTDELVNLLANSPGVNQAVAGRMVSHRTYPVTATTFESVSELQDIAGLLHTERLIENKVTVSDHVQRTED